MLFYAILISGFFTFGVVSIGWPERIRRYNFGLIRLVLPMGAQIFITRVFGVVSILFSLLIVVGLLRR